MNSYDVVVIGGGAAGLSGAVALLRSRRTVLVIDSGRPRNAPAAGAHNVLSREGVAPRELLALGRAEVRGYGGEIVDDAVTAVERDGEDFLVGRRGGEPVRARGVLVATGATDELPAIPGLAPLWGSSVLHCPYCHGWEVRDQAIGVLVGPLGLHHAWMFRQLSDDVTVFLDDSYTPTDDEWERLAARGISVVDGKVAEVESDAGRLTAVRLASGERIERQALVVGPKVVSRAGFLEPLGLRAEDVVMNGVTIGTAVPTTSPGGATAVPRVFVAGNVAAPMAQVMASAAAGTMAGAQLNGELIEDDTRRALAARVG